jgi:hypothetical protein
MAFSLEILAFPILTNRARYHTCYVEVPEEPKPLSAITALGQYYSFARLYPTLEKALASSDRLLDKDFLSIITSTPKGFIVWRWEPDAKLVKKYRDRGKSPKGYCKLLRIETKLPVCEVRVPDLDKNLTAIRVSGQFYGLLKSVNTREEAVELGQKLSFWGDQILVTPKKKGFALWIYEPNAKLAA